MFVFGSKIFQTGGMPVVVQKYGGTSVADPSRISAVADRVQATRETGNDVVVVVSAMGKTTDELLRLAREITDRPPPRELDMLLTAGERITMALLAMALDARSIPAVSYTGSQAGILTDSSHGEARIREVTGERVKQSIAEGKVVIVAGFQGVDPERREVTTLGRGGSDTTAVALAVALDADRCEIFTDVEGVFTADPRVVGDAFKVAEISFEDMVAMSRNGAGVLVDHAVEVARDNEIPILVRSSFSFEPGTGVGNVGRSDEVVGIAGLDRGDEAWVTVVGGGDTGKIAESVLTEREVPFSVAQKEANLTTFAVAPEVKDNVVRILHAGLFGETAGKGG
jgi:aspartate kinase